jgi:hypothetical protein
MKKENPKIKMMFGSIIFVIFILLTSLNPVVGSPSKEISSNLISPLFRIRIERAADLEVTNVLHRCFIGMGENRENLFAPRRDLESELFVQVMYKVCTMDNENFKKFVKLTINKLLQEESIKKNEVPKLKELFNNFRKNPDQIAKFPIEKIDRDLVNLYTSSCNTYHGCSTVDYTPISCLIMIVILIATFPIWFPIYALSKFT